MDFEEIVGLSVKHNVGDLHLCSGHVPRWRRAGRLETIENQSPVRSCQLEQLASRWLNSSQQAQLEHQGQIDLAVVSENGVRLRANFFQQRFGLSLALRRIATAAPTLQQLYAPEGLHQLCRRRDGLILVTGATGSGKSTTLAAMIACINQQQQKHILTLEEPIEFIHRSESSLIQQREIGLHCCSFAEGLRGALREDPDVILIGELRDGEAIRLALTAAETGHLVLATLHTRGAAQAVERLLDVFSADEKALVRSQLAGSLQAVIAQRLESVGQGKRVALFEMLVNTPAVSSLIREGKTHQIAGQMQTGAQYGMQTFDQSLQQRRQAGLIAARDGLQTSLQE